MKKLLLFIAIVINNITYTSEQHNLSFWTRALCKLEFLVATDAKNLCNGNHWPIILAAGALGASRLPQRTVGYFVKNYPVASGLGGLVALYGSRNTSDISNLNITTQDKIVCRGITFIAGAVAGSLVEQLGRTTITTIRQNPVPAALLGSLGIIAGTQLFTNNRFHKNDFGTKTKNAIKGAGLLAGITGLIVTHSYMK